MEIIVFILVLIVLIVVHEAGHFFAAKAAGIRVDEFGIGYPPRALTLWKRNGTEYTLNWLPFGGFVRIYGEDGLEDGKTATHEHPGQGFTDKNRLIQAGVLAAGIVMNLLFAFILLSITLAIGTPRALTDQEALTTPDAQLLVAQVLPGSPADEAGVKEGDVIKQTVINGTDSSGASGVKFTTFVGTDPDGTPVTLDLIRNGQEILISAIPKANIISSDPTHRALGVAVTPIGTQSEAWYRAPIDGAQLTWAIVQEVAVGIVHLIGGVFTLHPDLSQVSGPVGIAGAVGTAAKTGIAALLTITALISINLAVINVIPLPALDGGRLLFVIIEAITRRRIKPSVAQAVNSIGFALLILLMLAITAHDIFKIVA